MAFSGPLEDRQLIRERVGAYSDAVFQRDVEAWLDCWTDDAVRTGSGPESCGKADLRRFWDGTWRMLESMAFLAEVGSIEVEGDQARARVYCREILFLRGGGVRKVVGAYTDRLRREAGVWRFARRDYRLLLDEGTAPRA
jgi:ketosteroid isomerase-like protein